MIKTSEDVGRLLASKKPLDNIPGGRARGMAPSQFSSNELKRGVKIEHEHTPSTKRALEISMDHLKEFPDYYKELPKMERRLEKKAFAFSGGKLRPISKLLKPKGLKTLI